LQVLFIIANLIFDFFFNFSFPSKRNCFEEYVIHRFRSSLGKAKAIQKGDKVMICFSGGPSSR